MTARVQHVSVLAALLICLALTIGLVGSPPPVPKPAPAGGDDIPFQTWDRPTPDAKSPGARPRGPASIVPEGVAVLLLMIIWTACRALLSGRLGLDAFRRVVASPSHEMAMTSWLKRAAAAMKAID
jgi:hypothetical protein